LNPDCGAGVGRITEQLLLHHFHEVDVLEPSQHLIDTAEQNLRASARSSTFPAGHAMGRKLCMGLQDFDPEAGRWGGGAGRGGAGRGGAGRGGAGPVQGQMVSARVL
jgi:hypothetical protein